MPKVNMMAGKRNWSLDGWISIDGNNYGPHILNDDIYLYHQFDNSIDHIYCSHGIAYFDRVQADNLLTAWYNKLRPGGLLELATPDADAIASYISAHLSLQKVLGPMYGQMEMNGKTIYHKTIYNYVDLSALLMGIGFTDIARYDHRTTNHPNTGDRADRFDDHSASYIDGTLISLNVRAIKTL